jgi:AraC-like DNA-binding protein
MIEKTKSPVLGRRAGTILSTGNSGLRFGESSVWQPFASGWRPIFGGFYDLGVSLEWHDFQTIRPFEWSRSFHPESLELCLNLSGRGSIRSATSAMRFEPRTAGFYVPQPAGLEAWRPGGEQHRFLTVEFSVDFLRRQLAACDGSLHPLVEKFLRSEARAVSLGEVLALTVEQEQLVEQLVRPPVFQGARSLWYQSKVLQLIVDFLFVRRGEDELFCDRQKRLARERVSRVASLLQQRLAKPPSLQEIGRAVGCSPFYLSRTFSNEMRMTIPQYVRRLRMERSAELLRSGKYNVTEAALEVGYSSLSHFSQAFCQTMGCCPALYPVGRQPTLPHPAPGPPTTDAPYCSVESRPSRSESP